MRPPFREGESIAKNHDDYERSDYHLNMERQVPVETLRLIRNGSQTARTAFCARDSLQLDSLLIGSDLTETGDTISRDHCKQRNISCQVTPFASISV